MNSWMKFDPMPSLAAITMSNVPVAVGVPLRVYLPFTRASLMVAGNGVPPVCVTVTFGKPEVVNVNVSGWFTVKSALFALRIAAG